MKFVVGEGNLKDQIPCTKIEKKRLSSIESQPEKVVVGIVVAVVVILLVTKTYVWSKLSQ